LLSPALAPVAIQSCSNLPVFHLDLPSCMRRVGPEAPLSDRKQMIEALDEAFTEQMKRLFGVLAKFSDTNIAEAAPRFTRGFALACAAYEKAAAAIAATASRATG